MMFHLGQKDRITLFKIIPTPTISYKIYRFCCVSGKDHFLVCRCIYKISNFSTGSFICCSSFFSQEMYTTVDIGEMISDAVIQRVVEVSKESYAEMRKRYLMLSDEDWVKQFPDIDLADRLKWEAEQMTVEEFGEDLTKRLKEMAK